MGKGDKMHKLQRSVYLDTYSSFEEAQRSIITSFQVTLCPTELLVYSLFSRNWLLIFVGMYANNRCMLIITDLHMLMLSYLITDCTYVAEQLGNWSIKETVHMYLCIGILFLLHSSICIYMYVWCMWAMYVHCMYVHMCVY